MMVNFCRVPGLRFDMILLNDPTHSTNCLAQSVMRRMISPTLPTIPTTRMLAEVHYQAVHPLEAVEAAY